MIRRTRSRAKQETANSTEENKSNVAQDDAKNTAETQSKVKKKHKRPHISDDSSSESDLENYLKPAHEIDLNSTFFNIPKAEDQFAEIEKRILGNVNNLNDPDSSEEDATDETAMELPQLNFQQMQEHLQKIEEAKRHVAEYEAKQQKQRKKSKKKPKTEEPTNIADLLSVGEKLSKDEASAHSSLDSEDFASMSESEREDWEEVKESQVKDIVPKEAVQIQVRMPSVIREKKGADLLAAMKRRLNRRKKENQVFIHKVHLLCWIAHANFVNTTINSEKFLGMALSLIPSEQCYPMERTDLNYLEQVLNWYRKTVQHLDHREDILYDLEEQLDVDISKKQASNKKILVLIFICILRSLGIQCRLVLSLLVEPLRPPSSELCSLSTKVDAKKSTSHTESAEQQGTKEEKVKQGVTKKVESGNEKEKKGISKNQKVKVSSKISDKETSRRDQEKPKSSESTSDSVKKSERNLRSAVSNTAEKKVMHLDRLRKKGESAPQTAKIAKETAKSQCKTRKPDLLKVKMSSRFNKPDSTKSKRGDENSATAKIAQTDGANDSDDAKISPSKQSTKKPNLKKIKGTKIANNCPIKKHERRLKSLPDYKEVDSEEEFRPRSPFLRKNTQKVNLGKLKNGKERSTSASPKKQMDVRNDIVNLLKGRISEEKQKSEMKLVKPRRSKDQKSDDDSDYCPEATKRKKHDSDDEFIAGLKPKVKRRVQVKDENVGEAENRRKGNDIWAEVYLEAEEKWISVDVIRQQVHCVNEICKRATQPVSYILAWDNKNYIKDITSRYCPNWNTVTRKLRVDPKWWNETLTPYAGPKTARDKEEDDELARLQLEKPLPTTISEYKNHPLYALKRHLLKFEAIYPPDAVTLGFVRNEAVYSRECVHTLHSREIWLKHAKVVRPGEKPYKIVKARPKYDRLSNSVITDQLLEIFGSWQVDDYVPPTAENGIVPRNEYGNVELFKACMLPKGTVHLQLPGLNRVAKKLNIDCASAVVGFDFHSGWSHPMFDGFVVCEEYKDTLIAAWTQEQEEAEKRAQEKIEKRVYDNWKRLIKGLLIRERLKAKYDFGAASTSGESKQKRKAKPVTLVVKKRR